MDRRRRLGQEAAERLVRAAPWLMPQDRALVLAIYQDRVAVKEAAMLRGQDVRALRRRVRLITRRVFDGRFEFVLHHRETWPADRRRIATCCHLQGRTMRATAIHLQLSYHTVRKELAIVEVLYETLGARPAQERAA